MSLNPPFGDLAAFVCRSGHAKPATDEPAICGRVRFAPHVVRNLAAWRGEVVPGGQQQPGEQAGRQPPGGGLGAHDGEGGRADARGDRDPEREQGRRPRRTLAASTATA